MRLLVTGGRTGYLGRHVVHAALAAGHEAFGVATADADLRHRTEVAALLDRFRPDAVVHTAYVQSDWDATASAAAHVAVAAAARHARLVLVSSDLVFGGRAAPYDEDDPPDPVTPYGAAKAAAETVSLAVGTDVLVARTSLILGDGRSTHEQRVRDLLRGGDGVLFSDEVRCPVHVEDLAAALVELAAGDLQGVLHVGGADELSRFELGQLLARRDGLDPSTLRPGRRATLPVPGPIEVRLDSTRAAAVLTTRLRGAREFL